MKLILFNFLLLFSADYAISQPTSSINIDSLAIKNSSKVASVLFKGDSIFRNTFIDTLMFANFWDTIPQPTFWKKLMHLSEDSGYMNVANTRRILDTCSVKFYGTLNDEQKDNYRDSLRKMHGISDSVRVFFTTGKQYFYSFKNAIPNIDQSIPVFIENGVDPWYAQSILLIESPNKLQKSNAGAYGPFQLMKFVARKYGDLTINKTIDERKDVKRSAHAASMFVKNNCIPTVRNILDSLQVPYQENEIWFRLLVMHVYHAGGGNVQQLLYLIRPTEGGLPLIFKVWQTETGTFRNASQNYSQVLIAALQEFHDIIRNEAEKIQ
jgi:hypothetical protein